MNLCLVGIFTLQIRTRQRHKTHNSGVFGGQGVGNGPVMALYTVHHVYERNPGGCIPVSSVAIKLDHARIV
jgi:hypothetical protein